MADEKKEEPKMPLIHGMPWFPGTTHEMVDTFPQLLARQNDIFVATYAKAGTTWTQEMVWQIIHNGNIDYRRLDVRMPWLDGMLHPMPHNPYYASSPLMIERLFESFPAPRVFKTHIPYDLVPKPRDQATKPRYICVMRNPKDTAVSFYHHYQLLSRTTHTSWDEYFELFIKGEGFPCCHSKDCQVYWKRTSSRDSGTHCKPNIFQRHEKRRKDDEDFEPQEFSVNKSDKWEGEDEDDNDVKENWDDEDEDTEKKPAPSQNETEAAPPAKVKKRKTLKQALQEKEEKAKDQALRRLEEAKSVKEEEPTEEDKLAEKLKRQKLVEESDLEIAKQAFGIKDDVGSKSIDEMNPNTKEEFVELSQLIVGKLSNYESSADYVPFLEMLFRDLCAGLEAEDVKRLGSAINILSTEKLKAQKAKKGKKTGKKATLSGTSAKAGRKEDLDAFGAGNYDYGDEFDDFM
ncbi:eukaryotic translation initiation factor 3 subunit J-like isoform X2 [Orbicella faveolata]|uniref:eukaryotic translation initiation factor 3 subunit J-like isoform X2 n=1 Tax=Orbicella faveolata TaxID=48498 RepID=UPI0009E56F7B|nr:eukaryotic translation initiation factor 3 subunit J-like isoform X2 [Orbicella faveolata]